MLHRRKFLVGIGVVLSAPAIVHVGNLMPIRGLPLTSMQTITSDSALSDLVIDRIDILYGSFVACPEWAVVS